MINRRIKNPAVTAIIFSYLLLSCSEEPQLPGLSAESTILAFGNSLTYGTGAKPSESYPSALEELTGYKVINAGVPGELSDQGLKRFPETLARHRPDLVILCHGGNDILRKKNLAETASNINRMIAIARKQDIPVMLIGIPEPGIFLKTADFYDGIAANTGVFYLENIVTDILSDKSLKSDPVHPNKLGYRKMAEQIAGVLRQ